MAFPKRLPDLVFSHAALALIFTAFCAWYVHDAWSASATVENLILIAPAGIAGTAIGLGLLIAEIAGPAERRPPAEPVRNETVLMIVLLTGFVASMPLVGFTVSIFLFLLLALLLLGVRDLRTLVLYPVLSTAVLVTALGYAMRLPDPWIVELLQRGG